MMSANTNVKQALEGEAQPQQDTKATTDGEQPETNDTFPPDKAGCVPAIAPEGGTATGEGDPNANTEVGEAAIGIDPCAPPVVGENAGTAAVEEENKDISENKLSSQDPSFAARSKKKFRRHHFIKHEICIPDKMYKIRPVPKGKPWYLTKKKQLERRQDSSIAFVMPKQENPEVIALRKTNKMVQKLIKYMKKSWKIRVDRKQEERELEHRTLASVYTSKPEDWMARIRAREDRAQETGFFSAMDVPYDALIDLELDTALLTFKNLPSDLKITAARWIRARLRKEELKRKRDAYLPRLPHGKVKRPSYNKGRIIKDPGGVLKVDQFVKVADGFQRVTKGNTTFSKALKEWSQKKETESYNMNSGFGVVREDMFDFKKGSTSHEAVASPETAGDGLGPKNADHRRDSIVDGRKYQRDMLYFEKMMACIYDIMKSLLNIKLKQLESKFPLPAAAVIQMRGRSPDRIEKRRPLPNVLLPKSSPHTMIGFGQTSKKAVDEIQPERSNGNGQTRIPTQNIRKSLAEFGRKSVRKSDLKGQLSKAAVEHLVAEEVINLSPVRSTTKLVDDIKKVHSYNDLIDVQSRKQVLTAEQKIKRLQENSEHAAVRRARNYMTYTKLFERHNKKLKRPVWHHIDISAATEFDSTGLAGKDPAHLTEADAAEVVELALMKRKNLTKPDDEEGTRRWPEEHDIPTPTFPFPRSKVRIPSEEQSRLNLLKKTPHMDTVPSTPVRRLYKLAGIRTMEKDIFTNIMDMKRMFRVTENKLKVYYENEIGKMDWDTLKRFRCKLSGIRPSPVYQWTISVMRLNQQQSNSTSTVVLQDEDQEKKKLQEKRPALWYKKLQEEAEMNGATRHNGCQMELQKLLKYCDVDMKTKPHMINRLSLLVVSLPVTELGTKHWQQAVVVSKPQFMFGTPPEVIHQWLKYRGIPFLL